MNSETRTCRNCQAQFLIETDDFSFYEKIKVPPPTWCPECRFRRRIIWRNERKLFRGKSALSGQNLFTLFPPEAGYILYKNDEWRGGYAPLAYGQDVDFSRPFLTQLFELDKKVPKPAGSAARMVNSEYSDNASDLKNCYLLFNSNFTEDSAYGNGVDRCRACFDNSHIQDCERCYHSFWLTKCYETHFSSRCEDCTNMWFSKDCRGCSNCFGCVNLRAQKYCVFNKQYSKEEYQQKLKALNLSSWKNLQEAGAKAKEFWLRFPNKFMQGVHNVNVSGEFITHSKNVRDSYLIRASENLRYVQYSQVPSSKDCYDSSLIGCNAEQLYESAVCGWGASNIKFCWECWDSAANMEYCLYCNTSSDLFGCAGVQKKQYCILNKQYEKNEYEKMRTKIIEHMNKMPYIVKSQIPSSKSQTSPNDQNSKYETREIAYTYGEFFPPEFSPFAYTHTISPDHFPLSKDEAQALGFRWINANPTEYQTTKNAADIPDAIENLLDDVLKEILKCATCGRAYRIIEPELQFLKQLGVPAPRSCVDCRHNDRISQRNRAVFYDRKCMCEGTHSASPARPAGGRESQIAYHKNTAAHFHGNFPCSNTFQTSYSPEQPEIIYCEQCYQTEVA
ncbi:MAG: hypothetical protein HYW65_01010 [Candidatus Liptonbacteria bacterium]|nr:hypothetical protein [Candidatus Liptonbacteria bacterium]